ncbi:hypothetical protein DEU38_103150 [Rhodococcus sp. AG1013]|uniref:cyclic-phosphate processing receiver domain-containing protein n=1 Tax=Rhodococcus sp. AG1013 TaxID=2183996 RepID=UPI000E2B3B7D|nr:cyclic-phosphate processing receiver domain-containing protein [Rhodococcus sp. AG1013]RDI32417.1 hypothetical protein DEU38_103150 [Rhodococcus sp. AG1013]
MKLFVDDERPAPDGWELAKTAEYAITLLNFQRFFSCQVEQLSLDHDLGYTADTVMPVLYWMRDNEFWPDELYVHTANEDAEEVMLAFIRANAPSGVLRGWGCNFWGTGPDSRIQNWQPIPCPCTDLQAMHDRSFGDYMRCADCGTYYDTDGSRL